MGLTQITDRGGSALQIIPCTLNGGLLDNVFGTALSLNVIGDIDFGFSLAGSDATDEVNELQLIHGITVQTPKITKKIDKAGNEIVSSASSGSGGTGNSISCTVHESDFDFLVDMQALIGDTFIVWFPLNDTNEAGFGWLLGRFDGDLRVKRSGNAFNGVPLSIVGKSLSLHGGATAAEVITALTSAVSSITQPGVAADAPSNPLNPTTNITSANGMLVAGDIENPGLLAGTLVFKQGS